MNIDLLRKKIDEIDDEILCLIAKRYKLVKSVGEIKKSSYSSVFVPEREKSIFERLSRKTGDDIPLEAVTAIFREIISGARFVEAPLTILHLKDDALAVIASQTKFGSSVKFKPLNSLEDIYSEIGNNLNCYGVIPHHMFTSPKQPKLKIVSEIHLDYPSQHKFIVLGR